MAFKFDVISRWLRDFVPLIFWMSLIFWLSSQSTLLDIEDKASEISVYKSAHLFTYAVLAWLWWRALTAERRITWPLLLTALLLSSLYGISDEIHQYFVPGRHARIADVLFDTGGAIVMILLLRWIEWLRTFPESLFFSFEKMKNKQTIELNHR